MQTSLLYHRLRATRSPLNSRRLSRVGGLSIKARPFIWAVLFMFLFLGGAFKAQASHYRYGSITWTTVTSDPTNKTIQFRIALSYRTSYFSGPVVPGAVLSDGLSFNFGDGTSTPLPITVTSVNASGDYFFAETTLTKTYTSTGDFTAYFTGGDRLGSPLQNNANGSYYVSTIAKPGSGNRSPVATLPPIVNLAAGQANASFQINAFDADSDPLTFSLPSAADLGSIGSSFSQANGFAVSSSGLATFSTDGAANGNLYSVIVKVSDGKTYILLDFLIQIGGSGNPPAFVYGGITPNNGSTISVLPNTAVTFTVRATDPDATDQVSLQAYGVPPGATFTPVLPASGTPTASTVFSFTPTSAGSTLISFTADDPSGNQVATSVTIDVTTTTTTPSPCTILPTVTLVFGNNATVMGTGIPTITMSATSGQQFQVLGGSSFEFLMILDRINGYEIRQKDENNTGVFTARQSGPFSVTVRDANGCSRTVQGVIAVRP